MPLPIPSPAPPPPISALPTETVECTLSKNDRPINVWQGSPRPIQFTKSSQILGKGEVLTDVTTSPKSAKPVNSSLKCHWNSNPLTLSQEPKPEFSAHSVGASFNKIKPSKVSIKPVSSFSSNTPSSSVLLPGQFTISSNSEPIAVNGSNPPSHFINPKEGFVPPSHLVNTPLSPTLHYSVNPAEPSGSPTIPTQPPVQSNPDVDVSPSSPSNTITPTPQRVIELIADRQDYDAERQVVTAAGAVTMKFGDSVLVSDYLQINLNEQLAVATGKVTLTRQEQILQGKRLEYNYLQDRGRVLNGRGSINLQTANSDFSSNQPRDTQTGVIPDLALSSRLTRNQPFAGSSSLVVDSSSKPGTTTTPTNQASTRPQAITSSGDLSFTAGLGSNYADTSGDGGGINRLRYEAEQVDFNADSWDAINVRVTNDPFSPPEFELRSDRAKLVRFSRTQDELTAFAPKIVFDQNQVIPLPRARLLLDRERRNPIPLGIGIDERDRGGLYVEWALDPFRVGENGRFSLTPQFFIQRAIAERNFDIADPSVYGVVSRFNYSFNPQLSIDSNFSLSSLNLDDFENQFRANIQARQLVGNHLVALDYSYRDRLYNGSLGFQDVQSSLGLIVTSPTFTVGVNLPIYKIHHSLSIHFPQQWNADRLRPMENLLGLGSRHRTVLFPYQHNFSANAGANLWKMDVFRYTPIFNPSSTVNNDGFNVSYQIGAQLIEADTDRPELLSTGRINNRIELTRYQGSSTISRSYILWQGSALPPTPEEGLRFSPRPVVPYVQLFGSVTGTGSIYSQGDHQFTLRGTVGLQGQFGHFSRSAFDFTGFNVSLSRSIQTGQSPFLFDRAVDPYVLSAGIIQQVFGPIRIGFQTSINLENMQEISPDYILEYQRRSYSINIRYNPVQQIGALTFRVSDFNWFGNSELFEGSGVKLVDDGLRR